MSLGERLTKIRKEKGMSQEEFADKLGVSRQAVSKWERGEAAPDTDKIIAICKLFDLSCDELLLGKCVNVQENVDEVVMGNAENFSTKEAVLSDKRINLPFLIVCVLLCLSIIANVVLFVYVNSIQKGVQETVFEVQNFEITFDGSKDDGYATVELKAVVNIVGDKEQKNVQFLIVESGGKERLYTAFPSANASNVYSAKVTVFMFFQNSVFVVVDGKASPLQRKFTVHSDNTMIYE